MNDAVCSYYVEFSAIYTSCYVSSIQDRASELNFLYPHNDPP